MDSVKTKSLIVIGGPTGVGKTNLAISLAKRYHCDIINADSRQVLAELNIGVSKPSLAQLNEVKHHLIGHVSIFDEYNAGKFEQDAMSIIHTLFESNDTIILVGGTGLYIRSVMEGLDEFPAIPGDIKSNVEEIYSAEGLLGLQQKIQHLDPAYFHSVDQMNPRRLIRALEVSMATGIPYSQHRIRQLKQRPFRAIPLFIDDDRDLVYEKIDRRVDEMILLGLKEEVAQLLPHKNLPSLETVGYREWWAYFEGISDEASVIEKIKQHSRNYAKRQWTWWKPLNWPAFKPDQFSDIITYINESISNKT